MAELVDHGLEQVGALVGLDTPVLGVVHVDVATELGEIGVSQGPARSVLQSENSQNIISAFLQETYKGVTVSVLVSVEPDLDVDLAPVQPLEGQARHLLPHGEGLADRLVHVRPADSAGGGVAQDP